MEFITGNKFKSICNFYLDEFGFGKLKDVNKDEVVKFFVKTDFIDLFFNKFKPNYPFLLITHNSDFHITRNHLNYLNDNLLIKWFAQNVDIEHPKISSIPIGIANEKWPHGNIETLLNVIDENNKKNNLIYCNFTINTNYSERTNCLEKVTDLGIKMSPPKNFKNYLKELSQSYFVISPNGNGVDCHKTWESLYLKTIPIVTESTNINFYKDFPILIIKNWEEIKKIQLNDELYHKIWNSFDPNKLTINYFIK
jgi:hypothetical protein